MAVSAPAEIRRNVISPVMTCTLTSSNIIISQKDQKFSRIHSSIMASRMCIHVFRILVNLNKVGRMTLSTVEILGSLLRGRRTSHDVWGVGFGYQSGDFSGHHVDYVVSPP